MMKLKGIDMKKSLITVIALISLTVSAYAMYGVLKGQSNEGMYTFCYYTNGNVIRVGPGEICPVSNDD